MIAFLLILVLALLWNVALGCVFGLLWNVVLPSALGLPDLSWIHAIGVYLVIRLIVSPPKLDLTLDANR